MRYPEFLKKGDTIGFAAPSFGCATEPYRSAFDNALKTFRKMGYGVLLGPNCYKGDGIGISTAPEACGRELTELWCGDLGECSAIMACGGGELMCETMEYADLDRICSAEPKWYAGYSDNTNFIFPLVTICDTAAIYAPCAPAFGMDPWHKNLHDTMALLNGTKHIVRTYGTWESEGLKSPENPLAPYNCTEKTVLKIYAPADGGARADGNAQTDGNASTTGNISGRTFLYGGYRYRSGKKDGVEMHGRLLGGCLDILANLCGTKMDRVKAFSKRYEQDGIIWALESCDLTTMSMRRAMWQLDSAGWFDTAKGFLIGRPYHFHEPMLRLDQYDAFMEIAGRHGVPVVMDADIGHLPPMMPLIMGSLADVRAKGNVLTVDMKLQ